MTDEEKQAIAALAIDRLITDYRLTQSANPDLLNAIAACIQQADDMRLAALKDLLK